MTTTIQISSGHLVKIDECNVDRVAIHGNWHVNGHGFVACRIKGSNGTRVLLHRFIMNADRDQVIMHLNGDKLDNRIDNLVIQKYWRGFGTTKGVHWDSERNQWRVRANGQHIGRFDSYDEAKEARMAAKKK